MNRYYPSDSTLKLCKFHALRSDIGPNPASICFAHSSSVSDEAIEFVSKKIRDILNQAKTTHNETFYTDRCVQSNSFAVGRFADFTCSCEGEKILENMFILSSDELVLPSKAVIEEAIYAVQSLLVMGLQVGLKGPPQYLEGLVQHLRNFGIEETGNDIQDIAVESRRLKFERDVDAGTQILASLMRKRTAQGAFDLLVAMRVWSNYEDLSLLRSGFPVKFTDREEDTVKEALLNVKDYDSILDIRKDLRSMKVITIDNESTKEIDDGLSVEIIDLPDGTRKQRLWIHISDAEGYAPRSSRLFEVGSRRGTSIYLPTKTYPMFPESIAHNEMSLLAGQDSRALSLGVELSPSGEVDESSIIVTTSTINVDYRLTYDVADEMFEEGVAFNEEWELGALLDAAKLRREYRCRQDSIESKIETQLPNGVITTENDEAAEGGVEISIEVEYSHNSGFNSSTIADDRMNSFADALPLSPSNLLVTEMMILAGEAMGKWIMKESKSNEETHFTAYPMKLKLSAPFRSQTKPAFLSRLDEYNKFLYLRENQQGGGYCAAWYIRRFLEAVSVSDDPLPHSGLGLECYVQWSSPIRRFADLQVHAAVKRHLRAKYLNSLVWKQEPLPEAIDLEDAVGIGDEINYKQGLAQMKISRRVQNESNRFWLYEYLRRRVEYDTTGEVSFEAVVLGCIDTQRLLYVVFIHELGHEARYVSQKGKLKEGDQLWLKCQNINPRMSLITWTLSSKGSGAAL